MSPAEEHRTYPAVSLRLSRWEVSHAADRRQPLWRVSGGFVINFAFVRALLLFELHALATYDSQPVNRRQRAHRRLHSRRSSELPKLTQPIRS